MAGATMEMNIEAFRCYRPQPGDVLIVKPEAGKCMSPEAAASVRKVLEEVLPVFVKVRVLCGGIDVDVIRYGEQK